MDNLSSVFAEAFHSVASLRDNILLKVLALKADELRSLTASITSLFNKLVPEMKAFISSSIQPEIARTNVDLSPTKLPATDYRIAQLRISNVRGIPSPKNGIHFGIDFQSKSKDCLSAVVVGANGSGKSSIFSALEYMYTGDISEPKIRYRDTSEKLNEHYLTNADQPLQRFAQVITAGEPERVYSHATGKRIADIPMFKNLTSPDSSFVAESDIFQLSRFSLGDESDRGVGNFADTLQHEIAGLLGLSPYLEIISLLGAIDRGVRSRRTERKREKDLSAEILSMTKEINDAKAEIEGKQKELQHLTVDSKSDETKGLLRIRSELNRFVEPRVLDVNRFFGLLDTIYSTKAERDDFANRSFKQEEIEFLQMGLSLLASSDNCPLCLDSNQSKANIEKSVRERLTVWQKYIEMDVALKRYDAQFEDYLDDLIDSLDQRKILLDTLQQNLSGLGEFNEVLDGFDRWKSKLSVELVKVRELNLQLKKDKTGDIQSVVQATMMEDRPHIVDLFATWAGLMQSLKRAKGQFFERLATIERQSIDPIQRQMVEIDQLRSRLASLEKQLGQKTAEMERAQADRKALDVIERDIASLLEYFRETLDKTFEERFGPLRESILSFTSVLFSSGNGDELIFDFLDPSFSDTTNGGGSKELRFRIKTRSGKLLSPKYYLNAFRWRRLYSALSMAVALTMRIKNGMNLPLVIDDEILGADASNRVGWVRFFESLVFEFRKHTGHMAFQLLVFTQDEFVFDCIRDGLIQAEHRVKELNEEDKAKGRDFHQSWNTPISEQTLFARIFPPSDLEEKPRLGSLTNDQYWSLIGEFPSKILSFPRTLEKAGAA